MNDLVKEVWVTSAYVESVQCELDNATLARDVAIHAALSEGSSPEEVADAANLTNAELRRVMLDDAPSEINPLPREAVS